MKLALESSDSRIDFALTPLRPKVEEQKFTEAEGFAIKPEDSTLFLEWAIEQERAGILDFDEEISEEDWNTLIKVAFDGFKVKYDAAVKEESQAQRIPPSVHEVSETLRMEATYLDSKQMATVVNEILDQTNLTPAERQKLFASLMGSEGGIASTGAKTEAEIRKAIITRTNEAVQTSVATKQKAEFMQSATDLGLRLGLTDEQLDEMINDAEHAYNISVDAGRPLEAVKDGSFSEELMGIANTARGLQPTVPGQIGIEFTPEQEAQLLADSGGRRELTPEQQREYRKLTGTETKADKIASLVPPTLGVVPGFEEPSGPTQALGGATSSVMAGSQAASLLQQTATGFTPDQAAAQKATEEGFLSQADSSAVNKFTGGLKNPEFASFLSGQTEELFSQFQAAEAKKKTDFAPIAALQAKQGFQPGAGDFAPGTFSDFLKSSLPEVQESFVTKKKGQRKAKAAGTRVSFT